MIEKVQGFWLCDCGSLNPDEYNVCLTPHCYQKNPSVSKAKNINVMSIPLPTDKPQKGAKRDLAMVSGVSSAKVQSSRLIRFTIHGQPEPKGRPRLGKGGRTYTPKKTRQYERLVKKASLIAIDKPFNKPVFVHIHFYRNTKGVKGRRPDVDNLAKSVLDGMEKIAYANDSIVHKLFVEIDYVTSKPRAEVTITHKDNWMQCLEQLKKGAA